jgi:copper chaperone NosL
MLNWKNMKPLKIYSRIIVSACALAMGFSLFVSVWQIQLEAPQYPEGLKMEIWSHKIAGDIDKINGLNHYIGMAQIKAENFPEFNVMPWLIIVMIVLGALTAITGKRFMLWINASYLVFCGIWGIWDFWRWEYQYGHNLNPHAAIIIPGMAYDPPLFGWKQLLNFTAGSFPDIGGWLIIGPSIVIVGILIFEQARKHKKAVKKTHQRESQLHTMQSRVAA